MKKILILSMAALGLALGSCSDDSKYDLGNGSGEGRVMLRTTLNTDTQKAIKSRSIKTTDELDQEAMIWISNEKGLVRRYNGKNEIPAGGVTLLAGNYVAELWAGDSVPASFDHRYFKGIEEFTVGNGTISQVNLVGHIANVVASVKIEDGAADALSDISMTVGHKTGSLEFAGETLGLKGYFMMPSIDKDLAWTIKGTTADGSEFTKSGTIADAKPRTEYVLTVKHDPGVPDEIGAAFITVQVDENPLEEVEDEFTLLAAPSISGIGFDLSKPVIGEPEKFTTKSVWVAATAFLSKMEVRCDAFATLLGVGGDDFEIFGMEPSVESAINAAGVRWTYTTHDDTKFSELKLSFDKTLLNRLPSGEHAVFISATDENGKTSQATLNVMVSDALVMTVQVDPLAPTTWARKATLSSTIMKEGSTGFGIQYRKKGSQQWTQVASADASGAVNSEYTVELSDLEPGTTYEYQAYCDDFVSGVTCDFTTETAAQLPNAGFEEWGTSGKAVIPAASEKAQFWDTGNKGSATMSKQVTDKSTTYTHGGNYSAYLKSQWVGLFNVGKFAAGNIFVGEFLGTEQTYYGILGWGRPFSSRPRALRAWVKYTPGTIDYAEENSRGLKVGDPDAGIIYVAILNGNNKKDESLGTKWPCVVRTLSPAKVFSKNDQNVIGYGEHLFNKATDGDGMVQIEIPISYDGYPADKAVNIICVASASIGGDYYTGSTASEMYLDDIELVY